MKYYIDTEFIEDFTKPLFGKPRHYIDLISIGIVAEDGREYYAVSNEFDLKHVWNKYDKKPMTNIGGIGDTPTYKKEYWLRDNVLQPMIHDLVMRSHGDERTKVLDAIEGVGEFKALKYLIKRFGKSKKQIAQEIIDFVNPECIKRLQAGTWPDMQEVKLHKPNVEGWAQPEFYGYYADYDWVLFCSLYGRMLDLPKGYPMYCRDLKQLYDEKALALTSSQISAIVHPGVTHNVFSYWETSGRFDQIKSLREASNYPQKSNEHNALDDARWNKKLYDFIQTI